MEKEANGMQKRFWLRVGAKERETTTHAWGLDEELRSGEEATNRWREHFDNFSVVKCRKWRRGYSRW